MALECVLDAQFHIWGRRTLFDLKQVRHAAHTGQISNGAFGGDGLELPIDLALEPYPSVIDTRFDFVVGDLDIPRERARHSVRQIGVRSLERAWDDDREILRDCSYAGDALGSAGRGVLLRIAIEFA